MTNSDEARKLIQKTALAAFASNFDLERMKEAVNSPVAEVPKIKAKRDKKFNDNWTGIMIYSEEDFPI